jgi:hypothetical protein
LSLCQDPQGTALTESVIISGFIIGRFELASVKQVSLPGLLLACSVITSVCRQKRFIARNGHLRKPKLASLNHGSACAPFFNMLTPLLSLSRQALWDPSGILSFFIPNLAPVSFTVSFRSFVLTHSRWPFPDLGKAIKQIAQLLSALRGCGRHIG